MRKCEHLPCSSLVGLPHQELAAQTNFLQLLTLLTTFDRFLFLSITRTTKNRHDQVAKFSDPGKWQQDHFHLTMAWRRSGAPRQDHWMTTGLRRSCLPSVTFLSSEQDTQALRLPLTCCRSLSQKTSQSSSWKLVSYAPELQGEMVREDAFII